MKTGRNDPCPCKSGSKYKKCCGSPTTQTPAPVPHAVETVLERHRAAEHIRKQQQGLGRPIIATKFQGYQFVAAGGTLYYSKNWKTIPDFLSHYVKVVFGTEWGEGELRKPLAERHPILQWYDAYCSYQRHYMTAPGEVHSTPATGIVFCYMGLAYSLYLLKHNVELQQRFVERLKHVDQFQGAYYELIVANILIRAGFTLTLEDEADESRKHCEFSAVSQVTGKKYWAEAKMRGVDGVLGRTALNGASRTSKDPTATLTTHIRQALAKPAEGGERLIFSDVNGVPATDTREPEWVKKAIVRLDDKEKNLLDGQRAYVFVTNFAFHHALDSMSVRPAVLAHGLGIDDFSKPGHYRLSQMYKMRQKHIDAHNILDAAINYPHIPTTFDGSLSSDAFAVESRRTLIGEMYFFSDVGEDGIVGKVTSATVNESEKLAYYGIQTPEGKSMIITRAMTEDELSDYKKHPDAYFGVIRPVSKKAETPYELFEWLVQVYRETPKEKLLELFKDAPDFDSLSSLDKEDLLLECCERYTASVVEDGKKNESHQRDATVDVE